MQNSKKGVNVMSTDISKEGPPVGLSNWNKDDFEFKLRQLRSNVKTKTTWNEYVTNDF